MPETLDLLIKYFQGPQWLVLFVIVYIYSIIKSKRGERISIVLGTILFFVCVYNDVIYRQMSRVVESGVYYRFIWIIPVTIWISYGLIGIFLDLKKWWYRIPFILAAVLCMFLMDHTWLEKDRATLIRPANVYLIPDEVLEISDYLSDTHPFGEKIRVVLPVSLSTQLKCVDASVECVVPRRDYLTMYGQADKEYKQKELAFMIEKDERIDANELAKLLHDSESDYVVAYKNYDQGNYLKSAGCVPLFSTDNYELYGVGSIEE